VPTGHSNATGPVLRILVGVLGLLVALGLLVCAAASLVAVGRRDADDYLVSSARRISTASRALVSKRVHVRADAPRWIFGQRFATSRLQASSSRPVFVGIGASADVERYLSGVDHAVVTDVETRPIRPVADRVSGRARPAVPAQQHFWRVRSSGGGAHTVTWPPEGGRWSLVIMNADASPGVDVRARFGLRVPAMRSVAVALLAGGVLALLAAGLLLRSARTRSASPAADRGGHARPEPVQPRRPR
jgi:hypothetical protein